MRLRCCLLRGGILLLRAWGGLRQGLEDLWGHVRRFRLVVCQVRSFCIVLDEVVRNKFTRGDENQVMDVR